MQRSVLATREVLWNLVVVTDLKAKDSAEKENVKGLKYCNSTVLVSDSVLTSISNAVTNLEQAFSMIT